MAEITVEAKVEKLDYVLQFLEKEIKNHVSKKSFMQLNIAVEELFVNICSYAYAPSCGNATIQCSFNDKNSTVTIILIDSGIPYNPLHKENPDTHLRVEQRQEGGLGIFMAKNMVDAIHYQYKNGKNILTLIKKN